MSDKQKFKNWRLEKDPDNIVWCYIDVDGKSTNVLSSEVLQELDAVLESLHENIPSGLIILSGKDNGFIAGANIDEFTKIVNSEQALALIKKGQTVFDKLESLSCPTLSLINGFCLGGGLELALACDYRIALEHDKTRLGLPEVLLGIHPGFGGTMRLIRLLGPVQAIPLMLTGRTLNASRAWKTGLVDRVVPERQFLHSASALVLKKPEPRRAGVLLNLLNLSLLRKLLARYLRYQVSQRANPAHYPAPFALIDTWEKHGGDERELLDAEAQSVAGLVITETSRNLVRAFLLQERLKSLGRNKESEFNHVHVIGAGTMGGDIASWCVLQGLTVTLQDREPKYIAPAIKRAYQLFSKRLRQPRLVQAAMDRLIPDVQARGIVAADVVIEAIIEDVTAKRELFKTLEPALKENAILATNTSSIALENIGEALQKPERLVGIHFFNPVAKMQLVEIVHAANTAEACKEHAAAFTRSIGRLPLPVKSSPGFLINRILTPYLLETMTLQEEGHEPEVIDKVAVDFGMPMGPVELADTVGLDICLAVADNLKEKLNIAIPEKLQHRVAAGHLGKKSGRGFYTYKKGKPQKQTKPITPATAKQIEDRLVLRIVNECAACLREGIVADGDLLDAGMIFGTGFAPFRGGPLHYARTRGIEEIVQTLTSLSESEGERYHPDKYWQTLVKH